jgi:UrcA family protein
MQSRKVYALAAAATLMFAGVASAGEQRMEMAVRYDDLDLGLAKDAAIMVERLDQAAARVCGVKQISDPGYRLIRTHLIAGYSACHEQAMQTALSRLESQEVRHAYAAYLEGRDARG